MSHSIPSGTQKYQGTITPIIAGTAEIEGPIAFKNSRVTEVPAQSLAKRETSGATRIPGIKTYHPFRGSSPNDDAQEPSSLDKGNISVVIPKTLKTDSKGLRAAKEKIKAMGAELSTLMHTKADKPSHALQKGSDATPSDTDLSETHDIAPWHSRYRLHPDGSRDDSIGELDMHGDPLKRFP